MTSRDTSRSVKVAVLDYGIGNLRSAQKSLQRVGADAHLTADPAEIAAADAVVLPGVGAFGACMDALDRTGLTEQAHLAAESGRPFLGICVGMQLLYDGSEETPGRPGLGLIPGTVELLRGDVKRPQMQWNTVRVTHQGHPLLEGIDGTWMYFVHSYAAPHGAEIIATTDYGGPVSAVAAHNNVWATQFHPEKSAEAGRRLLANWVRWVERVSGLADDERIGESA
ncbi:MAG: imidazole glycerol phosphate synthase subunit HisH [Acidimicrobiales bacterium]